MFRPRSTFLAVCLTIFAANIAGGQVGDPTIATDHPQYPGEGAFQSIEDCVRFATRGEKDEQDKAIALYLWILTHQWHLASPQEWNTPGLTPDTADFRDDMLVTDANRARFSYGYGLCGTVHSWNEPYWRALGMVARRRAFPGHTNSEIFYRDAWHAYDTDMAGIVFRKDGIVAGYDDIIGDPSLVEHSKPPLPCYPFAWPSDFEGMRRGWKEVAQGGDWYKMYNSGYAAQPGIVELRRGESFTRWFDPDHYGGPTKRRFWHHQKNGPFRDWTFANRGTPEHGEKTSNARGNASYCNGEFVYRPDLSSATFRAGAAEASANLAHQAQSPHLHSSDGKRASVVFSHFSPYVICGDPVDDANPMSGKATDGLVVEGVAAGDVDVEVSNDQGQSWQPAGKVNGRFHLDLTEQAKGRYGWQVRFHFADGDGLDELQFFTTTQVCQAIYPRLTPGGCDVTYRSASRGVTPVLPNFGLADEHLALEAKRFRTANVTYSPRDAKNRRAYSTTNNKPAEAAFIVDAGQDELLEIHAAARYGVRVPPPEGCDFHWEVSTDEGKSWRTFARSDIPDDNEFSSGWVWGTADVSAAKANAALVRVHIYQGGYSTGLIDAQIYGVHRTPPPRETVVTYGWSEDGKHKQHVERIAAGSQQQKFTVPTGEEIRDEFIRLEAP